MTRNIGNENSALEKYQVANLRCMVAHEVFHIWDIYNNPERVQRSALTNSTAEITNFDPGENAAQIFGFQYRDMCNNRESVS